MAQARRFIFLDVLRGLAALWMIQVHVLNVLLDPALRTGWFFDGLNISNGFVAPTFIFCAGSGLWIALSRKGEKFRHLTPELFDYLRRLSYILFWSYMLHVPFFSLDRTLYEPLVNILPWLQIDVLQTIVYSSLAVLVVHALSRNLRTATWICGALAVVIMTGTAFIWLAGPIWWLPRPLSIMISPPPDSPFPLLPWSCYLFAGVFVTGIFMTSTNQRRLAIRLAIGSIVLTAVIFVIKNVPPMLPWDDIWWKTSPGLHLFRICGTVLGMSLLYLIEDRLQHSGLAKGLQVIGNESLFIYISHLLIVYGSMGAIIRATTDLSYMGYGGVAIVYVVITLPLLGIMWWWHGFKRERPELARRMLAVQVLWMILTFLLLPDNFDLVRMLLG